MHYKQCLLGCIDSFLPVRSCLNCYWGHRTVWCWCIQSYYSSIMTQVVYAGAVPACFTLWALGWSSYCKRCPSHESYRLCCPLQFAFCLLRKHFRFALILVTHAEDSKDQKMKRQSQCRTCMGASQCSIRFHSKFQTSRLLAMMNNFIRFPSYRVCCWEYVSIPVISSWSTCAVKVHAVWVYLLSYY